MDRMYQRCTRKFYKNPAIGFEYEISSAGPMVKRCHMRLDHTEKVGFEGFHHNMIGWIGMESVRYVMFLLDLDSSRSKQRASVRDFGPLAEPMHHSPAIPIKKTQPQPEELPYDS